MAALLDASGAPLRLIAIGLLAMLSPLGSATGRAAPPSDWEVMAIFIPADPDQQRQIIPRIYIPIEIEDLESKLAEEQLRRRESMFNSATLVEAMYVAKIDGGVLSSDASRWKFRGPTSAEPMTLGKVSVAMRDARGVDTQSLEQLSTYHSYNSEGAIELAFSEPEAELWFGFVKTASSADQRSQFRMQLPVATMAKMLVSTPHNYDLRSSDVVVEPVSNPAAQLPSDWPGGSLGERSLATTDRRWWLVNLSGLAEFTLEVVAAPHEESPGYKHTLRSVETDYTVGEKQMIVHSKFMVAASSSGAPLRIRLSDELRTKAVLVDSLPALWRSVSSPSGETNLIELVDYSWNGLDTQVEISASSEVSDEFHLSLPEVALADSYCISGVTRVQAGQGRTTDNVEAPGTTFTPQEAAAAAPEQSGEPVDELTWVGRWMGIAPPTKASFSRREPGWQLRGLTRFNVQSAWLAANARIQLSSENLKSNELRLQVSQEWFLDSIKLISDSEGDIRAQFVELGDAGERRTEIVITWERNRDSILLELDIAAHSPKGSEAEQVSLGNPRLVTLEGADQQDVYVIESSGPYRVQATASLLRFQLLPRELPEWQRALLPQLTDAWIFQDRRNAIPDIALIASGGTYSTSVHTIVVASGRQVQISYRIACRPISGSIDRLQLWLPREMELDELAFELVPAHEQSAVPIPFEARESLGNEEHRELELVLPSPRSSPFEIRGTTKSLQLGESLRIGVPGMPASLTADSTIILPKRLASFGGRPVLELLPLYACCSGEDFLSFEAELRNQSPAQFAAARVDASDSQFIELRPIADSDSQGWLWSESVAQHLWDDGSREYRVHWDLEVGEQSSIAFHLPLDWRIERVLLDGAAVDADLVPSDRAARQPAGTRTLELLVPPNRRSAVVLECSTRLPSTAASLPILARVDLAKPSLVGLPIFSSHYRVYLAPSSLALRALLTANDSTSLMDRLSPRSWWSLLSPQAFGNRSLPPLPTPPSGDASLGNVGDAGAGWSFVEWSNPIPTSPEARAKPAGIVVWIINRSALAALLLAVVLALGTLFWLALGKGARLWWLTLSLLAVSVLLAPRELVPLFQLVLLAGLAAAFGRLLQVVLVRPASGSTVESRMGLRTSSIAPLVAFLCLGGLAAASARAQAPTTSDLEAPRLTPSEPIGPAPATEIFGVLLPVNENSEVTGPYAYVPVRLWHLLTAPERALSPSGPPKILSADYLLRVRPGSSNAELSVEFRVQVTQANSELRLPFEASELQLITGQINGEERLVGLQNLQQESDSVVFRSNKLGTFPLSLQFVTAAQVRAEGLQFQASIPPVPNATLRIDADGVKVDINAIGGTQRSATGELLAHLGPLERLEVAWAETAKRSITTPLELLSQTWIHSAGQDVMAACQLRFDADQGLPQLLHVYVDSDWEPVGTNWGGAEILTSETMSFGNRRVYTVRMPSAGLGVRGAESLIRVLMVPRSQESATSLALPFLSLQEVSQTVTRRMLAWSSQADAVWKPDGVDFWPEVSNGSMDWGSLQLADAHRVYTVPPGTGPLQLRRQSVGQSPTVDESSALHLTLAGATLEYLATWNDTRPSSHTLRLAIPPQAQVDTLLVNGQPATYRISKREDALLLLVPRVGQAAQQVDSLDVKLTLPPRLDAEFPLPRVVLQDASVRSSRLRLFRGAMVDLQLAPLEVDQLQISRVDVPTSLLLDSLELLVGEFELGNSYREQPEVPLTAVLTRRDVPACKSCVMRLANSTDGWSAHVRATWEASAPLDFAFFDVPIATRDNLAAGSLARKFMPTADSSRTTLCMIPRTTANGEREVSFSFPLVTGVSGQSLSIPQVRLLANQPTAPVVALPQSLDGQRVTWQKAGRRLGDEAVPELQETIGADYELYAPAETLAQVTWQPVEASRPRARIETVAVELTAVSAERAAAIVSYWVAPRGQLELQLELPAACSVLGVEVSGTAAIGNVSDGNILSVRLQPNYLPVNVRLLLQWDLQPNHSTFGIHLPRPLADQAPKDLLVSIDRDASWEVRGQRPDDALSDVDETELIERWATLLVSVLQSQTGVAAAELKIWLETWNPARLGIDVYRPIDARLVEPLGRNLDENNDANLTVGEFWRGLGGSLPSAPLASGASERATAMEAGFLAGMADGEPRRMFLASEPHLTFAPIDLRERTAPRVVAAALLAAASLLLLAIATQFKKTYFEILSTQPWIYWMQIAAVAWLLLPVAWPGGLLALIALGIMISQWSDTRRRRPRFSRS